MYNKVVFKKKGSDYTCNFCLKVLTDLDSANKHEVEHDIKLVPIPKEELEGLLNYIYLGNISTVNKNLIPIFKRYLKMYVEE